MLFKSRKVEQLENRLKLAESALAYWVSYNAEMGDTHPVPDLALRSFYRKQAVKMSETLGIKRL